MRVLSIGLIATLFFIGFILPVSWAGQNPMFDFYNGLTEIIEKNMNNPKVCVSQSESYIKNNIKTLQKATAAGRKMVQDNSQKYENMGNKELELTMKQAQEAMSDPKIAESMNASMTVMNNFMQVLNKFMMKHPVEGGEIMDALSEYS